MLQSSLKYICSEARTTYGSFNENSLSTYSVTDPTHDTKNSLEMWYRISRDEPLHWIRSEFLFNGDGAEVKT